MHPPFLWYYNASCGGVCQKGDPQPSCFCLVFARLAQPPEHINRWFQTVLEPIRSKSLTNTEAVCSDEPLSYPSESFLAASKGSRNHHPTAQCKNWDTYFQETCPKQWGFEVIARLEAIASRLKAISSPRSVSIPGSAMPSWCGVSWKPCDENVRRTGRKKVVGLVGLCSQGRGDQVGSKEARFFVERVWSLLR